MKRLLVMMVLMVLLMPMAARATQVQDAERHFTFNLPAGWGMAKTDANDPGTYLIRPNGASGDFPLIKVLYAAESFQDNPQALVDEWKQNPLVPGKGTLIRNDVTYEKLTGHIVVDAETMLNGAAYAHVRMIMVSGKHSMVAVMLGDRTGDFWTNVAALNAIVSSLQVETVGDLATAGGSGLPATPVNTPASGSSRGLVIGIVLAVLVLLMLGIGAVVLGIIVWMIVRAGKNKKVAVRPIETRKPVVPSVGVMGPVPAVAVVGIR